MSRPSTFLPLSSPQSTQSSPQEPRTLLPSALPDTPTAPPTFKETTNNTIDTEPQAEAEPEAAPTPPPPDFTPLFTLLTTSPSPTTHHPNVHYIFSDDAPDSDPIIAAALQILDPSFPPSDTQSAPIENDAKTKERYILLDLDATGTKILSAQSMSPDWAVTGTELGPAPTWEGEQTGGEERRLMLRVEGVEIGMEGEREDQIDREGGEEGDGEGLEGLVVEYERRMEELRRVVGAGALVEGEGGEVV